MNTRTVPNLRGCRKCRRGRGPGRAVEGRNHLIPSHLIPYTCTCPCTALFIDIIAQYVVLGVKFLIKDP